MVVTEDGGEKMAARKIAVFVGSLRKEAYSRKLAKALIALAPPTLVLEIVEIGDLPLYNPDLEEPESPAPWADLRRRIKESDGVLFVTPEYNRSVPAAVKNVIDVGSRPYGKNTWDGKPGAVVSVSPGAIGAFGANHHLRQTLVFINVPCLAQPEAYIGGAAGLFDQQGALANDKTRDFLKNFMKAFSDWVEMFAH
jgi:chromate reductase